MRKFNNTINETSKIKPDSVKTNIYVDFSLGFFTYKKKINIGACMRNWKYWKIFESVIDQIEKKISCN